MIKAAIVIQTDPLLDNKMSTALSTAYSLQCTGHEVKIIFQGLGIRWLTLLQEKNHHFHALYKRICSTDQNIPCSYVDGFGIERSINNQFQTEAVTENKRCHNYFQLILDGYAILNF